nr:hypothetical protein [Tanacetum cinerariifolium]GFB05280.1 hypothetical protein [Tanacetum cinerariifolium]
KSVQEFIDQLFGSTSSKFSPTSLKEPTHPRDFAKWKEVVIVEEQVNKLAPYQEEGGSNPKMPKIKSFITPKGPLSQEEFNAQLKEIKRLADLKAEKQKLEQELRKMFNQATLKARAHKWTEHEAKKSLRAKFQWVINQSKKLGLHSPPALATFGMTAEDKKRKRTENLEEVFVKENVVVDGMHRNMFLPQGLKAEKGLSSENMSLGFSSTTGIRTLSFK